MFSSLTLLNCATPIQEASDIASEYLNATLNKDWEKAYSLISEKDKEVKDFNEYLWDNKDVIMGVGFWEFSRTDLGTDFDSNEICEAISSFGDKIAFEIRETTESEEQIIISYTITTPDLYFVISELELEQYLLPGSMYLPSDITLFDVDEEKFLKDLKEVKSKPYPTETLSSSDRNKDLILVKEHGKWRIFLDWHTINMIDDAERKISQAESVNEFEKRINLLNDAKIIFENILNDCPNHEDAVSGLERVQSKILEAEDEVRCIKKLKISNVNVYESFRGDSVKFEIENLCDRTIWTIELIVYCYDEMGKPIHEIKDTQYVNVKPGYIDKVYIDIYGAPSKWAKEVSIEILDIEFNYLEEL